MSLKRIAYTVLLYFILDPKKRADFLRKHAVFRSIGDNCIIQERKVPLYANLIKIGNNVILASNVLFVTHDATHSVINRMESRKNPKTLKENIGCIEIGNNVFVGCNTTILSNVRIGNNVIIGACSLINKDIPDNTVVAGVPGRIIGTFDDFIKKKEATEQNSNRRNHIGGNDITRDYQELLWDNFDKEHQNSI